jgi:hypothetical protein
MNPAGDGTGGAMGHVCMPSASLLEGEVDNAERWRVGIMVPLAR